MKITRTKHIEGNLYMIKPCEICGLPTLPFHHKFSQGKLNRELYGKLIDHPDNKQYICLSCNSSHQGQASGKLIVWHEIDFCRHFGIALRSKSGRMKKIPAFTPVF